MKTFRSLMETLKTDSRIKDEGLYSAVEPDKQSLDTLNKFCNRNFGMNAPDDIHCTVMYSTKNIPENIAKQYSKEVYTASPDHFEFWEGHDKTGYLVLKLTSDDLSMEHSRLKCAGCKPTFDNYSPHITIANPINKEDAMKKVAIGNNDLGNLSFTLQLHNQKLDTLKL